MYNVIDEINKRINSNNYDSTKLDIFLAYLNKVASEKTKTVSSECICAYIQPTPNKEGRSSIYDVNKNGKVYLVRNFSMQLLHSTKGMNVGAVFRAFENTGFFESLNNISTIFFKSVRNKDPNINVAKEEFEKTIKVAIDKADKEMQKSSDQTKNKEI